MDSEEGDEASTESSNVPLVANAKCGRALLDNNRNGT